MSHASQATGADLPAVPGYEVLHELGRGGMGVVYKARKESSQRLVAIKLIRDNALAGPQERARFRIEAEAAARMQHANIVQIYEVGEHAGRPFFAMELVEGGSLDKHLAGEPQPAPYAAELVRTLARAVEHAHMQKIVHRDLKPANILLSGEGGEARDEGRETRSEGWCSALVPKLSDFGLAKRLDSDSTAWTQEGAVVGTASYMAPEQAAGRVADIGPAVDVYALGAILYEALTGRPPFQGETWNQVVQKVIHDDPSPPTRLRPNVPRDLETICLKCLEKTPARRYVSAQELADDLGRFLDDKPVAAIPLDERERLVRLAQRDDYQIVGEIGRGPRSTVYHALYGPLKQPVALKVFPAGVCTRDEWESRLGRITELWAGLTHPHLLAVHRAGWWDGVPYLSVEFDPHGSLADQLTGQPFPVRQALRVVEQLAEIVSYLHRQGVVHGNLKPGNVLLAADDIPRLIDLYPSGGLFFGALPADDGDSAGLGYLPPEVVRDPGAEFRPYSDTYGLGLILYELLTGRPPFGGTTARDVLEQVRSHDPTPPSKLNSEVKLDLDGLCLRCLRKNPWKRYSRAYDVLTELRALRNNLGGREAASERRPKRRPAGR